MTPEQRDRLREQREFGLCPAGQHLCERFSECRLWAEWNCPHPSAKKHRKQEPRNDR